MERTTRLNMILDVLAREGRVDVESLTETLGVSLATARRDLDALAEQQLLTRTHGGAVAHTIAYDLPLRYKHQRHAEAKARIGQAAAALVPRGASIGLCGGTTATAIADAFMTRPDIIEPGSDPGLTVVTNAINIAMHLALRPQIKTVVTGGTLNVRSYELVGAYTNELLDSVSLDFAFVGANGFTPEMGPTTHDEREAAVNARLAARAERAYLVVDSSKFAARAFASAGGPELYRTVITDADVSSADLAALKDAGYEVIVA